MENGVEQAEADPKEKTQCMGPYAGVDYNLTLCRFQSRLQHMYSYHGQPYARVDTNPMPESTLSSSQELRIWPQEWKNPLDMGTLQIDRDSIAGAEETTEMEFMKVFSQGFWTYASDLGLESLPAFLPLFFPPTK